jgi:catechol 2,3-dioxygenase-like lactoylglutathione lyase family enzyme
MKPPNRETEGDRRWAVLSYAGLHHVKFPVTDLDASLEWYEMVLKAKREPRFDHLDADGNRFAVITFWPGLDVPCELRLAPKAARAVAGYDPVAFGVADERALQAWIEHFDAVGAAHTDLINTFVGKMVEVTSPDGLAIRLYVSPEGGFANVEFRPDQAELDNPSITDPLMSSS